MLPEIAASWVRAVTGATVVRFVERLHGGISGVMLALDVDGEQLVLRQMSEEPWREDAEDLLAREAAALRSLHGGPIPVPKLIALEPRAAVAGEPSLLMTRLPGRAALDPIDLVALARTAVAIHRHVPAEPAPPYELWTSPARWVVPGWARDPAVFRAAFARIDRSPPDHEPRFLHRDLQPGNVLVDGGAITGVVDWVECSTGPADLDVAHCWTNLAMLHGSKAARTWPRAYAEAGGELSPELAYWATVDAVAMLPDPARSGAGWKAAGRPDLTDALLRARLEEHLAAVVG